MNLTSVNVWLPNEMSYRSKLKGDASRVAHRDVPTSEVSQMNINQSCSSNQKKIEYTKASWMFQDCLT